jgi:hypothetical protein
MLTYLTVLSHSTELTESAGQGSVLVLCRGAAFGVVETVLHGKVAPLPLPGAVYLQLSRGLQHDKHSEGPSAGQAHVARLAAQQFTVCS